MSREARDLLGTLLALAVAAGLYFGALYISARVVILALRHAGLL